MSNEERPKITVDTPVSSEVLQRLDYLIQARNDVANQILDLELSKVQHLRAAQSLDIERNKIFEEILSERGLPQDATIQISRNGQITLEKGS